MADENKAVKEIIASLLAQKRKRTTDERHSDFEEGINALHEYFPDADIERELKNESFLKLIRAGVTPLDAFKAVHHDEIVYSMMKKAVLDEMQRAQAEADALRPEENAVSDSSAHSTKTDVSMLSKKDREQLAKRALMGEKIIL